MKLKLGQLATTQSGVNFRSRIEFADDGNALAVQAGNINALGELLPDTLTRIFEPKLREKYLAIEDDLLMKTRGNNNTVAVMPLIDTPALITSSLLCIRVDSKIALPAYVAWYLNAPSTQRRIQATARGATIKMVSISDIQDLKIDLPSLEKQETIAALGALAKREHALLIDITQARHTLIQARLARIAKQND